MTKYSNDILPRSSLLLRATVAVAVVMPVILKIGFLIDQGIFSWLTPLQLADELLTACLLTAAFCAVRSIQHQSVHRMATGLVYLLIIGVFVLQLSAFVGYLFLGSLPRIGQLQGLSSEVVEAAIIPLLKGHLWQILLAPLLLVVAIIGLSFLWRRRSRVSWLLLAGSIALLFIVQLADIALKKEGVYGIHLLYERALFAEVLQGDIGSGAISAADALVAKNFQRQFDARMRTATGIKSEYQPLHQLPEKKNIILLVLESVRAKDWKIYGGDLALPNIESLLPHSIVLENLYTQDVRSTKAYTALDLGMYGLLAWKTLSNDKTKALRDKSLPAALDKLGFYTLSIINGDANYDRNKDFQLYRGYDEVWYRQDINTQNENSDDALLLDRVKKQFADSRQPFYAMIWPMATHHPYGSHYWGRKQAWEDDHPEGIKHGGEGDYERYRASILETDALVGRLWRWLEEQELLENTVLIMTGDHGEAFGEHDSRNYFHGNNLYQESVHVPGIIISSSLKGPLREPQVVMIKDLPALILDIAKPGSPYFNDGRTPLYGYEKSVPVFLYNSFSKVLGAVDEQGKYRKLIDGAITEYYTPISGVPENELQEWKPTEHAKYLRAEAQTWYDAMRIRTRQILHGNTEFEALKINDSLRIYCNDGQGFQESSRRSTPIQGGNEPIIIPVGLECQSIRVAPVEKWQGHMSESIIFRMDDLRIIASDQQALIKPEIIWSQGVNTLSNYTFELTGESVAIDYKIAKEPVMIERIEATVHYYKAAAGCDKNHSDNCVDPL